MKRALALFLAVPLLASAATVPAGWIRIGAPRFEVFTCSSENEGRALLAHLEQIREFFQKASPLPLVEQFPVRIIAFAKPEQFAEYAPQGRAIAYYTASRQVDYIVVQSASPASYPSAVHEYIHLLARHSGLKLPLWLNEGWADVYSNLRPVQGGVAVGDLIEERMDALDKGGWLTLEQLTSVTMDSKGYQDPDRAAMFYGESWALAHMLFLSPEYSQNFGRFLLAVNGGETAAQAFQTAWGRSLKQVSDDLHNYLKRKTMVGRIFEVPVPKEADLAKAQKSIAISRVNDFDARLLMADLNVAIGRTADAKRDYELLAKFQSDNPDVFRSLGYLALNAGDKAAARQNFEKSFALGSEDPLMCFELALLDGELGQPAAKQLAALERAVDSKPDYTDALIQLGVMRVQERQYESGLSVLRNIPKVSARQATDVFWTMAYAYLEIGEIDQARASIETAKRWAKDPKSITGLDDLRAVVDARAKSPFAPKPGEKTERVAGTMKMFDCSASPPRLVMAVGDKGAEKALLLNVPELKTIELVYQGGATLKLNCGPQPPIRITVDYAPMPVVKEGPAGLVRRIAF